MPRASQGSALLLLGATLYPGICLYFAFCHSILNVGEPETLGCGGAGRINSGPGHQPHFQLWAAGTRYCLFVPPQNPEAKPARLDSSCPADAVGSGLAPRCRCHDSVQKALCLAVLARSNQLYGQTGCGLGGSQLPASDGSCFQMPREAQTLQPQGLRGLGREPWPDAGRPRSTEPTTCTLNYGGLGRVAGARPVTLEASALAVARRTGRIPGGAWLPGGAGPLLCRGR